MSFFSRLMSLQYRRCLQQPLLVIAIVLSLCGFAANYASQFHFDASSDTLIAKNDPVLEYYREFTQRFGESPYLVLTYTPLQGDLLVREHIERIAKLESRLLAVDGVKSVTSILDAPLLNSPPVPLAKLSDGFNTLRNPSTDLQLAAGELTSSPLFRELLISADGRSTLMLITLDDDRALEAARQQRDRPESGQAAGNTREQDARGSLNYERLNEAFKLRRARLIEEVRQIRNEMPNDVQMYLGGVPMIAADMIDYVKSDMQVFGLSTLILIALSLFFFFRRWRWVLIPLGTTAITILLVIGLLGFLKQPATIISSNFISLLSITTISFTIHLIARYQELRLSGFSDNHTDLVYETMKSKLAPCVYTGLTTIAAFGSLLTSEIVPVMDLGWIMCIGIAIAFFVTYSFFASVLVLLPKGKISSTINRKPVVTRLASRLAREYSGLVLGGAVLSLVIGAYGVVNLNLDNRFIDYFRTGTEIHDGMVFIDKNLGGTIPLDIVLSFPPYQPEVATAGAGDNVADDFADDFDTGEIDTFPERYWFTPDKIRVVHQLQAYLDSRPEIGKVISLDNLERVARSYNDGKPLGLVEIVAVLSLIPEAVRHQLIDPYASPATGELRISTRLHEVGPNYSRDELIRDIKRYATDVLKIAPDDIQITGMAVLFNDMLNKLFRSQTSTLVFVILAILIMFALLLKSATLAFVGLFPNILAAVSILGFMGYAGIPLDMMTITISAIVIGIGVDDAIHYLHRFKEEREAGCDVKTAVANCHNSIGNALYFTSVTVVIGFSVLSFSNFVPTIVFGLLAAFAMIAALAANLTVLPGLLVIIYRSTEPAALEEE